MLEQSGYFVTRVTGKALWSWNAVPETIERPLQIKPWLYTGKKLTTLKSGVSTISFK